MRFHEFYKSVFGILRFDTALQQNNVRIAGSGFVVGVNPLRILTCNHVVSEGLKKNDGRIRFSITKRTDRFDEFDLRSAEISFLAVKELQHWPELDMAILEVDPTGHADVAKKLNLDEATPLAFSSDKGDREPGTDVQWLSPAGADDLALTPRMFKGHIIASYKTDQGYMCADRNGNQTLHKMPGVDLLEVDKLFIPGVSGSPIVSSGSGKVVGYVHGFRSWPIPTNTEITQEVQLTEHGKARPVAIKSMQPLLTSLSLAIDTRSVADTLRQAKVLA